MKNYLFTTSVLFLSMGIMTVTMTSGLADCEDDLANCVRARRSGTPEQCETLCSRCLYTCEAGLLRHHCFVTKNTCNRAGHSD